MCSNPGCGRGAPRRDRYAIRPPIPANGYLTDQTGIVRSPVFTTFTQVFARSVQVWAINYAFPTVTEPSMAYAAMLLAWAMADTIRYLYFAIMLADCPIPGVLKWAR